MHISIFITLVKKFVKYSKLRVLDPNLSKIRDQIKSQDENNTQGKTEKEKR